jgi:hypothetical protein
MRIHLKIEEQAKRAGLTQFIGSLAAALALLCAGALRGSDGPVATEAQVKAAFLLNFAKYADWPASAFAEATAPITIGLIGTDSFGDTWLRVEGKTINGRAFIIKHLAPDADIKDCQILFISHSESARMAGILRTARSLPILTVGEDAAFTENGGIINFVLKNGKVRLEIDLAAARKAGVVLHSRLLAVADTVKGKEN